MKKSIIIDYEKNRILAIYRFVSIHDLQIFAMIIKAKIRDFNNSN